MKLIRFLASVIILSLLFSGMSALAESSEPDNQSAAVTGSDKPLYEQLADTVGLDWKLKSRISFSLFTDGNLLSLTGGRYGGFYYPDYGVFVCTAENSSSVMYERFSRDDAAGMGIARFSIDAGTDIFQLQQENQYVQIPDSIDYVEGLNYMFAIAQMHALECSCDLPLYIVQGDQYVQVSRKYKQYVQDFMIDHLKEAPIVSLDFTSVYPEQADQIELVSGVLQSCNAVREGLLDFVTYDNEGASDFAAIANIDGDLCILVYAGSKLSVAYFFPYFDPDVLAGYIMHCWTRCYNPQHKEITVFRIKGESDSYVYSQSDLLEAYQKFLAFGSGSSYSAMMSGQSGE